MKAVIKDQQGKKKETVKKVRDKDHGVVDLKLRYPNAN